MIATSIFGGLLIGLASVCLMLFQGRIAGISSIVYRAILPKRLWNEQSAEREERHRNGY